MHLATSTRHLIQLVHQCLTATVSLTVSKATAMVLGDDPFRAEKRLIAITAVGRWCRAGTGRSSRPPRVTAAGPGSSGRSPPACARPTARLLPVTARPGWPGTGRPVGSSRNLLLAPPRAGPGPGGPLPDHAAILRLAVPRIQAQAGAGILQHRVERGRGLPCIPFLVNAGAAALILPDSAAVHAAGIAFGLGHSDRHRYHYGAVIPDLRSGKTVRGEAGLVRCGGAGRGDRGRDIRRSGACAGAAMAARASP
jgi:hypothetical protein